MCGRLNTAISIMNKLQHRIIGFKQHLELVPCCAWPLQPSLRISNGRVQIIDDQGDEQNKELPYDRGQKYPAPVSESQQYTLFQHWPDAPSGGSVIACGCLKGALWHKSCEEEGGCNACRGIIIVFKMHSLHLEA